MKNLWAVLALIVLISISTNVFADNNYGLTGNETIKARAFVVGAKGERVTELEKSFLDKIELVNNKYRIENANGPEAIFSINISYAASSCGYVAFMECKCLQMIESPFSGTIVPAEIWGSRVSRYTRDTFQSLKSASIDFSESCYETFLSDYLRERRANNDH